MTTSPAACGPLYGAFWKRRRNLFVYKQRLVFRWRSVGKETCSPSPRDHYHWVIISYSTGVHLVRPVLAKHHIPNTEDNTRTPCSLFFRHENSASTWTVLPGTKAPLSSICCSLITAWFILSWLTGKIWALSLPCLQDTSLYTHHYSAGSPAVFFWTMVSPLRQYRCCKSTSQTKKPRLWVLFGKFFSPLTFVLIGSSSVYNK